MKAMALMVLILFACSFAILYVVAVVVMAAYAGFNNAVGKYKWLKRVRNAKAKVRK